MKLNLIWNLKIQKQLENLLILNHKGDKRLVAITSKFGKMVNQKKILISIECCKKNCQICFSNKKYIIYFKVYMISLWKYLLKNTNK